MYIFDISFLCLMCLKWLATKPLVLVGFVNSDSDLFHIAFIYSHNISKYVQDELLGLYSVKPLIGVSKLCHMTHLQPRDCPLKYVCFEISIISRERKYSCVPMTFHFLTTQDVQANLLSSRMKDQFYRSRIELMMK